MSHEMQFESLISCLSSKHVCPVAQVHPKTDFIQVLINEFTLRASQGGSTLEVRFDPDSPAVFSPAGRDAVRRKLRAVSRVAPAHQKQIDAFLAEVASMPFHFSDSSFPFRYVSGGILPIVRLGSRDYYAFFWRDIFPIGWNIANGGSDSIGEMLEPQRTIDREFREELLIAGPDARRLYAYPKVDDADALGTLPVARAMWQAHFRGSSWESKVLQLSTKWIHGPDSVLVAYGSAAPVRSAGYFLNINAEDFGIEVDRVARIRLEEEPILLDGELWGNELLNQPVGLFEAERTNSLVANGAADFRPDQFFYDGRNYEAGDLERVIREGYLPHTARFRDREQRRQIKSQQKWFDLCPATRQIILRYIAWEERASLQVRRPPSRQLRYEVFLCFKHEDADLARRLYGYLVERGLTVFYSEESIELRGISDYTQAIDDALDDAECLVVVGTRREHISAPWPRYEWNSFHNDMLTGAKPGGRLFTLVTPEVDLLPRALRMCEKTIYDERDPESALGRVYRLVTAG